MAKQAKIIHTDGKPISNLELKMFQILENSGFTNGMEREITFHPKRRWRLDFAWPEHKIAIEVHGKVWHKGGHTSGVGRLRDMEKGNAAKLLGWIVLEIGDKHIEDGTALEWVRSLFQLKDLEIGE